MVWDILKAKLEVVEAKEQGDWRVSCQIGRAKRR